MRIDVPIACTLEPDAVGDRVAEWRSLVAQASGRSPIDDGIRFDFPLEVPVTDIARLAAAERDCCAFFTFGIKVDADGTTLDVTAPSGAQDLMASLFGNGPGL